MSEPIWIVFGSEESLAASKNEQIFLQPLIHSLVTILTTLSTLRSYNQSVHVLYICIHTRPHYLYYFHSIWQIIFSRNDRCKNMIGKCGGSEKPSSFNYTKGSWEGSLTIFTRIIHLTDWRFVASLKASSVLTTSQSEQLHKKNKLL